MGLKDRNIIILVIFILTSQKCFPLLFSLNLNIGYSLIFFLMVSEQYLVALRASS